MRLLPLLFAAGCAELDPYLPVVHFDRLDVHDVTFEDISTSFVFRVENPNPIGIDMASFSYALSLEQIELLAGEEADGLRLEASDASEVTLPVDLVFASVFETVEATRGEDIVDFGLAGRFGFETPIGPVELPYDEAGTFPALRTPKIALGQLRVTNVGLFGADLELDVDVDNDHGSSLIFQNFDWRVDLQGDPVAEGILADFGVDGASTGKQVLPIHLDFLTAAISLVDAVVQGDKVDVALIAATDVDTPFGVVPLQVDVAQLLDAVL